MNDETGFVICGALGREVLAIVARHGWRVRCYGVAASDHTLPQRIAPHVEHRLRALIPLHPRIVVVYGDCGSRGELDAVLAAYNVPRIDGPHCYEMYGGVAHDALMAEQPGTFFLTDFLVRGFNGTIWKTLGLDRHPELIEDYFRNYTRIVYLSQNDVQLAQLQTRAHLIATQLNLPLQIVTTGYGALETRLVHLMGELQQEKYKPTSPDEVKQLHDDHPSSILARHPSARARKRRSGTRERAAACTLHGSGG